MKILRYTLTWYIILIVVGCFYLACRDVQALDNATVAREKAKIAQVSNIQRQKEALVQQIEMKITDTIAEGKFEVDVEVDEYEMEIINYAKDKISASGYKVEFREGGRHYNRHYLNVSW